MRKLINSTYITLDGVIENPMWTMSYFDEEAGAFAGAQTDATWKNAEVLQGDLVEAVTALKAQEGKNILQYGYGPSPPSWWRLAWSTRSGSGSPRSSRAATP